MTPFTLVSLGGSTQVTGSCHLLQAQGLNIVIDCGIPQGHDAVVPMDTWPVSPSEIHFLFLTHAHIDHIGRVPELIGKGFKGEITEIYSSLSEFWDQEARDLLSRGDRPMDFDGLYAVRDHKDHLRLVHGEPGARDALSRRLAAEGHKVCPTWPGR